jgi:hypothetical protein
VNNYDVHLKCRHLGLLPGKQLVVSRLG